jgi:hypothetical protein
MVLVFWYWARWVGLKMAYTKHIPQFEWENMWVTSWSAQYFRQTHCLNSLLFSCLFYWDTANVQLPLTSNLHVLEKGPHGWIFHETMLKLFPKRALRRYDMFSFSGQKTYSVCIKLNLPYVQKKSVEQRSKPFWLIIIWFFQYQGLSGFMVGIAHWQSCVFVEFRT